MNLKDFCKCEKSSSLHTDTNDWYQFDICNDCGKVIEDGVRPINDNGNY